MRTQASKSSPGGVEFHAPPAHVAIIMDGNGRWAEARGLARPDGHRAGAEHIGRILRAFANHGVRYLTLYAFSTENWERPTDEVNALIGILQEMIRKEASRLHNEGVRLKHIGRLDRLPAGVRQQLIETIRMTAGNTGLTVALAYDYGGRAEMTQAVRAIVRDAAPADEIDEALIGRYLYTAGIPDPDLIVRTAGEMRLSNFLLWQAAYAEFYSTPVYWPDFDEGEVAKAIEAYRGRRRKYGRVDAEAAPAAR